MFRPTLKHFAFLVVAGAGCCFASAARVHAGGVVAVSSADVCDDQCDSQCPSCCDCLCWKLKLHCIYFRKACHRRYIALPYTDPSAIMYYAPGLSAAGGDPMCPPAGASYGYPGYGSGNAGYVPQPYAGHSAYASPGTVFIR
jgi:hypothetical protein